MQNFKIHLTLQFRIPLRVFISMFAQTLQQLAHDPWQLGIIQEQVWFDHECCEAVNHPFKFYKEIPSIMRFFTGRFPSGVNALQLGIYIWGVTLVWLA